MNDDAAPGLFDGEDPRSRYEYLSSPRLLA
jgi:hypothetical protein